MKVERMARSGQISRQRRMRSSVFSRCAGRRMRLQHRRRGVLERDVEIGEDLALRHQRDDLVDMRVGIDVVQADPGAELAERRGEVEEAGPHLALAPEARRVFEVDAVGAGVLRDDEELLDARLHEPLGLAQHVAGRAADEIAAQLRDDAERAAVVAALGNLQIGVVPGRELDALRRHEVEERVVRRRRRRVHGRDDALVGLRPGDREHVGEALADLVGLGPHAAGDDDLAVLGHRLADGAERFRLGAVEEAAGVDDDEIGAGMRLGQLVALGAELRDDALGIDERLRAAERHEGDLGSGRVHAKKGFPRRAAGGRSTHCRRGSDRRLRREKHVDFVADATGPLEWQGSPEERSYRTDGLRSAAGKVALRDAPSGTGRRTMSGLAQMAIVWLVGLLKKRRSGGQAARNMKLMSRERPSRAATIVCRLVRPFSMRAYSKSSAGITNVFTQRAPSPRLYYTASRLFRSNEANLR